MRRRARTGFCSIAAILLAVPPVAADQAVQYGYDAAGRLSVVADARGDLAVYDYDAVGNLLSIRRVAVADAPDPVFIAHVVPGAARRGATVSIFGKGFAEARESNTVTFNGAAAVVLAAAPTRLTVKVPPDATTGPIRLSAPRGAAVSRELFHVLGSFSVMPSTALVGPRGTVQFTASGNGSSPVRWSVDGVAGGDALNGTITNDGLYVAPAVLRAGSVTITATSVHDPAIEATARIGMIASRSLFLAAGPVGVGAPLASPRVDITAIASVGVATISTFATAAPLALRVAPVVMSVSPPDAARGEMRRLSVRGAGFDGATRLEFLVGTEPDPALSGTDLEISSDGSEATVDVAVAVDAGLGPRTVRVITPTGSSGAAVLGDNVFTVR
jgi:RHS repeat protein/IPT/TIG domain-containing protein